MSIFSDHELGYMDDFEFEQECKRMNRQDRHERVRFYDPVRLTDDYDDDDYEDEDEDE